MVEAVDLGHRPGGTRMRNRLIALGSILFAAAGCTSGGPGGDRAEASPAAPSMGPRETVVPPRATGPAALPLATVRSQGVMGELGWPLGSLMTVEGTIVPEDVRRRKEDMGKTLARIDRVAGAALARPVICDLRGGNPVTSLKPGSRVRLLGYEAGAFVGAPQGLFKYVPAFTTTGFGFKTWFDVVKVQP
jgi:hypothetical protein